MVSAAAIDRQQAGTAASGPSSGAGDRRAAALRLQGIRRSFGAYTALKGIDLTIEPGEFIALLGPSGCGKTTALNCIAGLLPLSGGAIVLGDRRIDTLQPEDRGFGMVFQSYALFPHMTCLLYTSPSPRDRQKSRMPSSA